MKGIKILQWLYTIIPTPLQKRRRNNDEKPL
jgi:hypothetical protein